MSTDPTVAEAERSLLGRMMMTPDIAYTAMDRLSPADFQDVRHETIASTVYALIGDGKPADSIAVSDEILRRQVEGVEQAYVLGLTSVSTYVDPKYLTEIVKRHANLRRAAAAASTIQQGIAEGWDILDITEKAHALLDGLDDRKDTLQPVGETLDDVLALLGHPPEYRPTRWMDLNGYINGLMPGAVYVVAARPGSGKTIAGLNMAVDLCAHGKVLFFSLEMPKNELIKRLTASEGSVSLTTLMRHTLQKEDWAKVSAARQKIQALPLYIDDRSAVSMTQIEATARQAARGNKLSGIVIDYLQLIPSRDARKSRWEHVGELTRAIKILAKDLRVPVIVLCQLNRESEKNQRMPGLSDLRESGSIEQDADVVIMLQRRLEDDGLPGDQLDVVIPKNRHGQMGRFDLRWEGKFARLLDMPRYTGFVPPAVTDFIEPTRSEP